MIAEMLSTFATACAFPRIALTFCISAFDAFIDLLASGNRLPGATGGGSRGPRAATFPRAGTSQARGVRLGPESFKRKFWV